MDTRDGIHIHDESEGPEKRHQLYINGQRRGLVTKAKNGDVKLHWQIYGPMNLDEAKAQVEGLLELVCIADQLSGNKK
jgi:hypothetical protein